MRAGVLALVAVVPLLFGSEDGPVSPERDLIDPAMEAAAAGITSARVRTSTDVLADDAMAGRGTPTPGLESAAVAQIAGRPGMTGLFALWFT